MSGHIDDDAVDHFAAAMKEKLAEARAKGRSGWHGCDPTELSYMLRDHVEKGDPRDVANFCMFLWSLGQSIGKTVIPIGALADVHDLGFERGLAAKPRSPEPQREIAYTPGEWFDATTVDLMEAFYRSRLPAIREAARQQGYAIGVHGSLRRDLDLIAAPWRDGASDADTLAAAIQRAACGFENERYQWERKPLGRLAVSMPICWTHRHGVASDGHIDLSVLPSIKTTEPADPDAGSRAFVRAHVEAERAQWTGQEPQQ